MKGAIPRRGRPMTALAVLLALWVTARALVWQPTEMQEDVPAKAARSLLMPARTMTRPGTPLEVGRRDDAEMLGSPAFGAVIVRSRHKGHGSVRSELVFAANEKPDRPGASVVIAPPPAFSVPARPSQLPYVSADASPPDRRWSADAWMLLRDGGIAAPATGLARATYGASQLGAVVRYRLDPDSGHRPTAYLRASAALVRSHEKEAATGLSVRPVPGLPITIAAEMRVGDVGADVRVRPAVMAVTELLPKNLPQNLRAEAYAQAGYVGGRAASAFIDGQLRVDRPVARSGGGELRIGAGAWGGAQKGASRLDLGPTAVIAAPISDGAFMRLALDWRLRIAGNAVPQSGPALTLSAGF